MPSSIRNPASVLQSGSAPSEQWLYTPSIPVDPDPRLVDDVLTSDDADEVMVGITVDDRSSYKLIGLDFGFAIPTGSLIIQIYGRIRARYSGMGGTMFMGPPDLWPTLGGTETEAIATLIAAESTYEWNFIFKNGPTYTVSDINSANFGLAVAVQLDVVGMADEAYIDQFELEVVYQPATLLTAYDDSQVHTRKRIVRVPYGQQIPFQS